MCVRHHGKNSGQFDGSFCLLTAYQHLQRLDAVLHAWGVTVTEAKAAYTTQYFGGPYKQALNKGLVGFCLLLLILTAALICGKHARAAGSPVSRLP